MKALLIGASFYAASLGLQVKQDTQDITIITNPEQYTVNEDGDCIDDDGEKVAFQSSCCNVDTSSPERIELFKGFCENTIEDEVCAKLVYHIETDTCDRTAVERTKYYSDITFDNIVGDPDYYSSFVTVARG